MLLACGVAAENMCRDAADLEPLSYCQDLSSYYLEQIGQASWADVTCHEISNTNHRSKSDYKEERLGKGYVLKRI